MEKSVRHRPSSFAVFLASVAVLVALAILWALTPEDLRGFFLLAAMVLTVLLYGGLYVVERRRHW